MGRDFKRIVAWQKADALVLAIYAATRTFPDTERYGLTSQIRHAALSVAANIAEGSGRGTDREFLHFLHIAQGSLSEVEYFISISHRLGYLDATAFTNLENCRAEAGRVLHGFIESIAKPQGNKPQAASGK